MIIVKLHAKYYSNNEKKFMNLMINMPKIELLLIVTAAYSSKLNKQNNTKTLDINSNFLRRKFILLRGNAIQGLLPSVHTISICSQ